MYKSGLDVIWADLLHRRKLLPNYASPNGMHKWNSIPQNDIRHLYNRFCARTATCNPGTFKCVSISRGATNGVSKIQRCIRRRPEQILAHRAIENSAYDMTSNMTHATRPTWAHVDSGRQDHFVSNCTEQRCRGGVVVRLPASHLGEPGSIPGRVTGFSRVGIVPDDATGRRIFSNIPRFSRPCVPALLHAHLASSSSPLKTSISLDQPTNKVIRPNDRRILHRAKEYTTGTQADLKQGFRKWSLYRVQPAAVFTEPYCSMTIHMGQLHSVGLLHQVSRLRVTPNAIWNFRSDTADPSKVGALAEHGE
ncbi:hypothetical protein PR048_028074 [Dryococelus australis]|uniref:Uncharacterized protein n=1 Tax=Dryococelus australis TaxID=614101 RepID=A0ABQ9GI78_9NEOP|nr:hypothetical protein PR048_028074 [Dryococelus australis]